MRRGQLPSLVAARVSGPVQRCPGSTLVVGATCLAFLVVELLAVFKDAPLGHDESVYSGHAREIALGKPRAIWFRAYRAPGLPWLLARLPIGVGESQFRLVVVAVGIGMIVLTYMLGRILFSPTVGAAAAVGMAASPVHAATSSVVLPDVPGAVLGLACAVILLAALRADRLPWWTWAILPLAAAATWMRFGAPGAIGCALGVVVLFRWERVRPQLGRVALLGAGTAGVCLLVLTQPVLVGSAGQSALQGVASRQSGRSRLELAALPDFMDLTPEALGKFGLILGVFALAVLLVRTVRRRVPVDRDILLCLAATVATVLLLAYSLGHGEGRYLEPAMPWAFVGIAGLLVPVASAVMTEFLWSVRLVIVLGVVVMAVPATSYTFDAHDRQIKGFDVLQVAATAIPDLGYPCPVITSYSPQVEWYSRCDSRSIPPDMTRISDRHQQFTVLLAQEGKRQPTNPGFERFLQRADGTTEFGQGDRRLDRVWLYRFASVGSP